MEAALFGPSGRVTLGPTVVTIGSAPGNQLLINDPFVSLYHAEIRPQGQGYYIVDLESTNHTFINDYQLTPYTACSLNSDDRIRFGKNVVYTYEVSGVSQETETLCTDATIHSDPKQNHQQQQPTAKRNLQEQDAEKPTVISYQKEKLYHNSPWYPFATTIPLYIILFGMILLTVRLNDRPKSRIIDQTSIHNRRKATKS
jgi:pSer/pThr/pTyr-binding forkhead associated (FHA) protein